MNISRHKVDPENPRQVAAMQRAGLEDWLGFAARNLRSMDMVASTAGSLYRAGSVLDPVDPAVTKGLVVCPRAIVAMMLFGPAGPRPTGFVLWPGNPLTFDSLAEGHFFGNTTWVDAFWLAALTRQGDLLGWLRDFPPRSLGLPEAHYDNIDFHRDYLLTGRFTRHPGFEATATACAAQDPKSQAGRRVHHTWLPYLEVLRRLDDGDKTGFEAALADGLKQYRKYWGGNEKRRADLDGFVSTRLAMAAAVAHDRGWRFDVTSDYIPTPWVTGEAFRGQPFCFQPVPGSTAVRP